MDNREEGLREGIRQVFDELRRTKAALAELRSGIDPEKDDLRRQVSELKEENAVLKKAVQMIQMDKTIDSGVIIEFKPDENFSLEDH